MKFKPNKSRCLVIRKGQVTDKFALRIQEEVIQSLKKHLIKCLGKWFDAHNNKSIDFLNRLRMAWRQLTRCNYQESTRHGCTSMVCCQGSSGLWLFTRFQQQQLKCSNIHTVSKYLRRWLGVLPSFTNIGLYGTTTKLQLPLSYVLEEFKVSKTRLVVILRDSRDQLISQARIRDKKRQKVVSKPSCWNRRDKTEA